MNNSNQYSAPAQAERLKQFMTQLALLYPEVSAELRHGEPMSQHTTFRVGGPAALYWNPSDIDTLAQIMQLAAQAGIPVTLLGQGSNALVEDGGLPGLTIQLNENLAKLNCLSPAEAGSWLEQQRPGSAAHSIRYDDAVIYVLAQSGCRLSQLAEFAAANSLSGLEFACGIPGSIGGAVFMNAGAYGYSLGDFITASRYIDSRPPCGLNCSVGEEHEFSYRHSLYEDNGGAVVEVLFCLQKGDQAQIRARMADYTARREASQPLEFPSAGSVFRRPVGYFAGKLISDAGLRGCRIGGAEVSQKHAGFIINVDHATADDVKALIRHIRETVYQLNGVDLQPEVRILGAPLVPDEGANNRESGSHRLPANWSVRRSAN
ncbi:MAG: UDP-N-acetylmuramate dehydrogenase [Oscillospiraceae bacterium]|nr:UDP-N-acetylmuramate dehydrogenase [Oscillospiraceae bacterium]MDD4367683.1 UDP-N-acetylmuramate dehydrogenase [Oscillospiraceae bacterium]